MDVFLPDPNGYTPTTGYGRGEDHDLEMGGSLGHRGDRGAAGGGGGAQGRSGRRGPSRPEPRHQDAARLGRLPAAHRRPQAAPVPPAPLALTGTYPCGVPTATAIRMFAMAVPGLGSLLADELDD